MKVAREMISVPAVLPARSPMANRVVSLYPDKQQVWRHKLFRMPAHSRIETFTYGADAGFRQQDQAGGLIDIYA
jgi:hypothetical protein